MSADEQAPSSFRAFLGDVRSLALLAMLKRNLAQEASDGRVSEEDLLAELDRIDDQVDEIRAVHWSRDLCIEIGRGVAESGGGVIGLLIVCIAVYALS